ncbi:hypothetical protein [Caldimonas sp. KR1-144]|uniref:hypothetical protein n=1 Tax=Caldimonas sp. KR1-144 TaxID=3400911 RepID=UPI003BFEBE21
MTGYDIDVRKHRVGQDIHVHIKAWRGRAEVFNTHAIATDNEQANEFIVRTLENHNLPIPEAYQ